MMKKKLSLNKNLSVAVATAVFDFDAAGEHQLSFRSGDRLLISSADVEVVESGQDWVFARHTTTLAEGFVPSNFIQVNSAEEESKIQIITDIKDLRYQIEAAICFKDGLRDIIRKTKDNAERKKATINLKETEKNIDELEDQLDKLEIAFKSAYPSEELDPELVEEDDDDDGGQLPADSVKPLKPFSGVLRSILKKKPSKVKKTVRFDAHKTFIEMQHELGQDLERMSLDEGLVEESPMTSPMAPPPPKRSSIMPMAPSSIDLPPRRASLVTAPQVEPPPRRSSLAINPQPVDPKRTSLATFSTAVEPPVRRSSLSTASKPVDPPPRRVSLALPVSATPLPKTATTSGSNALSSPVQLSPAPVASRPGVAAPTTLPTPKPNPPANEKPIQKKKVAVADLLNPPVKGNLHHYTHSALKSWNKRYCVLKDAVIYIFKKPTDSETYDRMVLPSFMISPCVTAGKQFCFKAEHPGGKPHIFAAESKDELNAWLLALSKVTNVNAPDLIPRRPQGAAAADRVKKRTSIEGAAEGLALKTFRSSVATLEED